MKRYFCAEGIESGQTVAYMQEDQKGDYVDNKYAKELEERINELTDFLWHMHSGLISDGVPLRSALIKSLEKVLGVAK